MKKFYFIGTLIFSMALLAMGIYAGEEKQNSPVGEYDLLPVFQEKIFPQQRVTAVVSSIEGQRSMVQTFDLTMKMKIVEIKNNLPSKLEYIEVTGPQKFFRILDGKEKDAEIIENKNGIIRATVDENLVLQKASDIGKLSNDILNIFPPGPFLGFVLPSKKVKVGEQWSSGSIVPLGPRTFKKKKMHFSEITGQCKLEKILSSEKGRQLAQILWQGKGLVDINPSLKGDLKWERRILYDLQSKETMKNKGFLQIQFKGMPLQIIYDVSIEMVEKEKE